MPRGLLAEMEQRLGYGLDELARRFDRSVSWVPRRRRKRARNRCQWIRSSNFYFRMGPIVKGMRVI